MDTDVDRKINVAGSQRKSPTHCRVLLVLLASWLLHMMVIFLALILGGFLRGLLQVG